ncbi:MAG TPA: hypothetical protein VHC49_09510 [Mycobacteriales bacterium]|nr:hypothetical protein [Mycobacteriales bacterium]
MELGSRRRSQPAPPGVVWRSLADPHDPAARPWLDLTEDEIEPQILESREPELIVWSSLWPERPDDRVRFDIEPDRGGGSMLRWTVTSAAPVSEPARLHVCYRMNVLINASLRYSYGQ